ncbi:MAG: hypothetical protein M3461_05930 [Pseudomonadota bacterium]|nr:hypothetical protein [Pseudomonadota bacterium]
MVNTKRGRFTSAFWRSLGVFLLSIPMGANALEISNGVPEGTVGHYRVDVTAGGETRTAFVTAARFASNDIFTTEVVFDYSSLVDPGNDGLGFSLSNSDIVTGPFADPNNPNIVTSSGSFFGVNQNVISWTAVSSIAPGAQVMTTTYTFTAATGALGPLRFLQYLDEDVQGAGDDVFLPVGTAAGNDLELFTFDNTDVYGLSHSGALLPGTELLNAAFAGWAADRFNNMRPLITGAGQPVSPDGVITNLLALQHPQLGPVFGPADVVSVLAWDVDPNAPSAVITTSLGGIPISQQTVEARPVGSQIRCKGRNCTFQATCILPPSPGALCTNRISLTVGRNALRSSEDTSVRQVRQRRRLFASGAAAVPPGQTAPVRLRLTPSGRRFVQSTTKKRLRGLMEVRNVAGTTVNSIPFTIRIRR